MRLVNNEQRINIIRVLNIVYWNRLIICVGSEVTVVLGRTLVIWCHWIIEGISVIVSGKYVVPEWKWDWIYFE